ncbi:hypothetical protein Prudu_018440, partial [Prunus dulcis]
ILYPSLFSPSLSLSSLSLLRAIWVVRPFAFQGTGRPPQADPISAVGTYGSTSCRRHNLTDLHPGRPDWPENRVFRRRFVRSYPNFQLEILLRTRARQDCKRDLRRVKAIEYAGSTTGPVIASAPPRRLCRIFGRSLRKI